MAKNSTAVQNAAPTSNGTSPNSVAAAAASAPAPAAAEGEGTKKTMKAFVQYIKPDNTVVNFPTADCIGMRTSFSNGVARDLLIADVNADVQHCSVLQGFATRTQRSYNAVKEIDGVIEAYDETVADLKNGVWIEARSGEPKVTLLAKAIVLSLEAAGQTVDDERRKSIIAKLATAENRDKANANEQVKMHLANLKLEAAQDRAKEAREAAKKAGKEGAANAGESLASF